MAEVHVAGCRYLRTGRWEAEAVNLAPSPKPAKGPRVLLTTGQPWVPKKQVPKRKKQDRRAASNYKLLLQFMFQRPVSIEAWKRIKAPRGWRKCPTGKDAQSKYCGVRFICRELKFVLTPDEIEELRARLYLSLELVF